MDSVVESTKLPDLSSPLAVSQPVAEIPRVSLLGVGFHSLTLEQAIGAIERIIERRQPASVCFSNAYTLSIAQKDKRFFDTLNNADLVLADGMSIVWGARWIGVKLPGRVAGPDLMEELCAQAPSHGYRIFLLGSSEENLQMLAHKLQERTPDLSIVGTYSPPICERVDEVENEKIIALINEAKPDVLFVGLSAPKQEKWIADNLSRLHVPACLGVGAAFDFLSGRIPRAPQRMRDVGLEWLYRLWCEPKRLWKRYLLGNAIFLSLLLREALKKRWASITSVAQTD